MEAQKRLSKGLRRHIRNEKALIRRQFNNTPEANEKIRTLIKRFHKATLVAKLPKTALPQAAEVTPVPAKKARKNNTKKSQAKPKPVSA